MNPEDNQEDYGTVNTLGAEKEKKQSQNKGNIIDKASNAKNTVKNAKELAKNSEKIQEIMSKMSSLGIVGIVILIILIIIGFIGFFTSLPGVYVETIKEFGLNLWSSVVNFFTGEGVTASITEEDQIELAQKIQDLGYDIVGYGFADAKYEYDDDPNAENIDGVANSKIVGISTIDNARNYLQAYIAQSESMYVLSSWNVLGEIKSAIEKGETDNVIVNLFGWIVGNESSVNDLDARLYSEGMLNVIMPDGIEEVPLIKVDRNKKLLRIQTYRTGADINLEYKFGDILYFDLSDWTSIYGKPIELFLSLHLATMMPDLTYDLATSDCFNTKVNIELQDVKSTYKVIYRDLNGKEMSQEELETIYLKVICNMNDVQIKRFSDAGKLDEAFKKILNSITNEAREDYVYAQDGSKIDNTEEEKQTCRGFNLSEIEESILGEKYSKVNVTIIEKQVNYGPQLEEIVTNEEAETIIDRWLPVVDIDNSDEVSVAQTTLENLEISNMTIEQLEEIKKLIIDGSTEATTYLPRITGVIRHWYYNDVEYNYGTAGKAKKKVQFTTDDEESPLSEENLNGASIILDTTYTNANGVFYQLTEPEANGPNDAIVALFKGGSGSNDWGDSYNFPGEYYRFDGTRMTAQLIANAKAAEEGKDTYYFQGTEYTVENTENSDMLVSKQPVSFVTTDQYGNESKKDAINAFAILENVHTVEAESIYRMLKELVIDLGYFTNEDFMKPLNQVLLWPVEKIGSDTQVGDENEEVVTKGISKRINQYGIFLQNGVAVNEGDSIIAPGDATIESVEGNTITIKFKTISDGFAETLKKKFGTDYFDVDKDIVLDMEMTIDGINPSVSVGQEVTAGTNIGTATSKDIQIIMYDVNRAIVDDIEQYMYPTYEGTTKGIFETLRGDDNSD